MRLLRSLISVFTTRRHRDRETPASAGATTAVLLARADPEWYGRNRLRPIGQADFVGFAERNPGVSVFCDMQRRRMPFFLLVQAFPTATLTKGSFGHRVPLDVVNVPLIALATFLGAYGNAAELELTGADYTATLLTDDPDIAAHARLAL